MDDKQLLEALRGIVREETRGIVREETAGFATKADLANFATKADLTALATQESMDEKDRQLRVLIENSMGKIENLLREDYGRVAGAAAKVADYDKVKGTVAEHQTALENHSQRLTELEKKAI